MPPAIAVRNLDFSYDPTEGWLFRSLLLEIEAASRCLLLGQNGAGKTTLLRILGGKHMVPREPVRVLGRSAFHDTELGAEVLFLGGPFPFDVDMSVAEVLARRPPQEDPRRRRLLLDLLGIDPAWRMQRVSAGQRRRVQVLLGLLRPMAVVLLDEVTADLDVLARADLLAFLRRESEVHGTTVLYATHVLDGLARWATHLCFLSPAVPGPGSRVRIMAPIDQVIGQVIGQAPAAPAGDSPLLLLCERWLREDREAARPT